MSFRIDPTPVLAPSFAVGMCQECDPKCVVFISGRCQKVGQLERRALSWCLEGSNCLWGLTWGYKEGSRIPWSGELSLVSCTSRSPSSAAEALRPPPPLHSHPTYPHRAWSPPRSCSALLPTAHNYIHVHGYVWWGFCGIPPRWPGVLLYTN